MSRLTEQGAAAQIAAEQAETTDPAVRMVGEQLKEMLREEPALEEILLQDLQAPGMTLADCEKQIAAYAMKHRQGNKGCCPPQEAEKIIRKFYGLPEKAAPERADSGILSLLELL